MRFDCMRVAAATFVVFFAFAAHQTFAQGSEPKATDQRPSNGEGDKNGQKKAEKIDEYAEAEKLLGGPAANPECMWLGRRVVSLLWRDDLDTAFRHLDLYDRFGCPAGHIQATFRCVIRQGSPDQKAADKISDRVHACWVNPSAEMQQGTAAAPSGTTNR